MFPPLTPKKRAELEQSNVMLLAQAAQRIIKADIWGTEHNCGDDMFANRALGIAKSLEKEGFKLEAVLLALGLNYAILNYEEIISEIDIDTPMESSDDE